MRDVTPVADRRFGNESAAKRAAEDARDAGMLRDRVTAAFGDVYLVGDEVGRGGMAVVYSATDVRLQRIVALKVLPPDLAFRAEVRERFVREAQTSARLNHPHIVPIYAVHEGQGLVCFAMSLVRGESLGARLMREPRPAFEYVAMVLEQAADALAYAHAAGVVHRDIKPDNILLDSESGRVMVTDFGIARAAESGSRLTQTGIAVGTPAFMSPEQATGEREVDGRSDVYSLGVVGYLMLAGRLPFEASTTPAMLVKHLSETPPPITRIRPDAPRMLADILERCLAKRPEDRWENAMQLRDALRGAQRSRFAGGVQAIRRDAVPSPQDGARNGSQNGGERPSQNGSRRPAQTASERLIERSRKYGHHHDDWAPVPAPTQVPNPPRSAQHGVQHGSQHGNADARPGEMGRAFYALPPIPAPPVGASKRELRQWERSMKEQRQELKRRWKLEREDHREARSLGIRDVAAYDGGGIAAAERISRYRGRIAMNVAMVGMLFIINANTGGFPWVIFPAFGMTAGLIGQYARLRSRGITWGQIIGVSRPAEDDSVPNEPKPQRIALTVQEFRRRMRWFGGSVAVAAGTLAVGASMNIDALIPPFAISSAIAGMSGLLAGRSWFRLRSLGVTAREALSEKWRAIMVSADDRPREIRIRDEIARIASKSVLDSKFGDTVRSAADDRVMIRETSERLTDADRALVPDVEPTADALLERIGALAAGLERLEADLPGNALPQLDARIASVEAEPEHAPDRERRLTLLTRQRASLAELDERKATMQRQLESASMALRSLRLDMVKLRTLGVGAAIDDVTNATQEARALSRDIGRAVEAAAEVRRI